MSHKTDLLAEVKGLLGAHSMVRGVDAIAKGHIRLQTNFLYPDGSFVDLFVVTEGALVPARKLSDLGQTMGLLLDVQVKPWLSSKRKALLNDILDLHGVCLGGGALELEVRALSELPQGVVCLGQTCVRVADLIFTKRTTVPPAAEEEIEEVVSELAVGYEVGAELPGRYGELVKVDFLVKKGRGSAVLSLSNQNAYQAHTQAVEIFRKWYDLETRNEQLVTVLDDRFDTYKLDDIERIKERSALVGISDSSGNCSTVRCGGARTGPASGKQQRKGSGRPRARNQKHWQRHVGWPAKE